MTETGSEPEQTMIIGDSSNDIRTGRNAGAWTGGVTYGFAPHTLSVVTPDVCGGHADELKAVADRGRPRMILLGLSRTNNQQGATCVLQQHLDTVSKNTPSPGRTFAPSTRRLVFAFSYLTQNRRFGCSSYRHDCLY